jgi:hypothetical protein
MKLRSLKLLIALVVSINFLTGCLYGQCINGPCALEHTRIVQAIKPYGAHWVKEGMTRENRLSDFTQCGGYANMREGYEIQPNQSTTEFFKDYNAHVTKVAACMRAKGYTYLEQCDARCLHP